MGLPWTQIRRWTLAGALLAATWTLGWRIRAIRRAPRLEVSDRVASLMDLRIVSRSVFAYAKEFGRPAFNVDSIYAHLDSAKAADLNRAFAGLWQFRYQWSWCDYRLVARTNAPPDSVPVPRWLTRGAVRYTRRVTVEEGYTWPAGVGRTTDCYGGPVAIDDRR